MVASSNTNKLRVLVVGGGVAALETALALGQLAPEQLDTTLLAPNTEFVYRPMTVREPFAYSAARRYPLASLAHEAGARLIRDELVWVEPRAHIAYTRSGSELRYDALVLAVGARPIPRYSHATTIDDRQMDAALHGVIQDVEDGYLQSMAFISPARMGWQLPLYELALLTAGRAYDMNVDLRVTLITPEDAPLAIFGAKVSAAVSNLLARARIQTIYSAYVEVSNRRELLIHPGDRDMRVSRVIALPELFGPSVRGIPLGEHGFIRVDPYGRVPDVPDIYAAGDATDFPVKHGGIGSQQADVVAQSIAARAGAAVTPEPFRPVIRAMLLTDARPLYLSAQIVGGRGLISEVADTPTWPEQGKIAAKYLSPCLSRYDREMVAAP